MIHTHTQPDRHPHRQFQLNLSFLLLLLYCACVFKVISVAVAAVVVSRISYVRVVVLLAVKPITRRCYDNNKQTSQQTILVTHMHTHTHTHTYALGERTLTRAGESGRAISLQFN